MAVQECASFSILERMEFLNEQRSVLHGLILDSLEEFGVRTVPADQGPDDGADFYALVPGRDPERPLRVPVQLKERTNPLPAGEAALWQRRMGGPAILAQASVPRGRGAQYRSQGVNYIDSGGNAFLRFPGFTVHVEGRRPRVGAAGPSTASASATPTGLRVTFALLIQPDAADVSYHKLADLTGASTGSVANTISDLRQRGHIVELGRTRRLVDTDRLARNWVTGYTRDLAPRLKQLQLGGPGPGWWIREWRNPDGILAGGVALAKMGGNLRPDHTVVYGQPPWRSIRRDARLTRDGGDPVTLREQFWSTELLGEQRLVPPLLAYADALNSGDPRETEVAQELAVENGWPFRR
jgi:hypothetical protein